MMLIIQEIDEYIKQAKEKGYTAVLQLGSKGVNYATSVIMQTAIKVSFKRLRFVCVCLALTKS